MKLIEKYRKKDKNNEFLDKKQRISWLESAVSTIEDELMDLKVTSSKYKEALKERAELLIELMICSDEYRLQTAGIDYK